MRFEQKTLENGVIKTGAHSNDSLHSTVSRQRFLPALDPKQLSLAYQYCSKVSWKHAKTFYFATHFLPAHKRFPVYAVYALCRYVDDLVDRSDETRQSLTKEKILALLNQWRADLDSCYNGLIVDHPIMMAWYDMLQRYSIPKSLPLELIDGVCMDLKTSRYQTFDDLYVYVTKSLPL
jgi:Phytoene/squalene synthetase